MSPFRATCSCEDLIPGAPACLRCSGGCQRTGDIPVCPVLAPHPPSSPAPSLPRTILLSSSHPCSAEAGPDFELRLELYGACVEEEGALAGAPKRLATKLSSSLGRSSGRRVRASLEMAGGSGSSPILLPTPAVG